MSDRIICPMTLADVMTPYHERVPECALLVEIRRGPHIHKRTYKMCAITAFALAANEANGTCVGPVNAQAVVETRKGVV